ncbi:MAG: efflux RND transporter periplasmic adaptor subunit [Verrucomicrobia bacterium]|nr:efflux RND transporter periplasmic adaptor subunit [Verrucomicrobiota bacterium]
MNASTLECKPDQPAGRTLRESSPVKSRRAWPITLMILFGLAGFGVLAVMGIRSRSASATALQLQTNSAAELSVAVVTPEKAPATVSLDLPGQTQAYIQSPIFAQTTGYLKRWYFDIGAKVKAGDVLAEIDTPQVDQQLNQAKANLRQAQAALDLARVTYARDRDLLQRKVIAQQDFDTAESDFRSKEATVNANAAAVSQLQALQDFKIVRAPFTGVVIARNTDIGQIVNAGSGAPLFTMAQVSPLRIYVNVPERMAGYVQVSGPATVTFNEFPGQKFQGKVVRTARAIDPNSRTLLTEIDVANDSEQLLPGAYAPVHLDTSGPQSLLVPANALLFRSEGTALGVVGPDGRVRIKKIKIGRDLGGQLEIVDGISPTDQVIVNPVDSLSDGMLVRVSGGPVKGISER